MTLYGQIFSPGCFYRFDWDEDALVAKVKEQEH